MATPISAPAGTVIGAASAAPGLKAPARMPNSAPAEAARPRPDGGTAGASLGDPPDTTTTVRTAFRTESGGGGGKRTGPEAQAARNAALKRSDASTQGLLKVPATALLVRTARPGCRR